MTCLKGQRFQINLIHLSSSAVSGMLQSILRRRDLHHIPYW